MTKDELDAFRERVRSQVAKLRAVPTLGTNADIITQGRISGLYLALSLLPEPDDLAVDLDRWESEGGV